MIKMFRLIKEWIIEYRLKRKWEALHDEQSFIKDDSEKPEQSFIRSDNG